MANNIVEFTKLADEITIREADGVAVVTIRGAARLTGVSQPAISKSLKTANQKPSKLAKSLMEEGFEGDNLLAMLETGIVDEAMAVIAHYYAYEAGKFCTSQAKHLSKQFQKIGVRASFYAIKGVPLGSFIPDEQAKDRQSVDALTSNPDTSSSPSIFIPELNTHIRCTDDGYYSIYDLIEAVRIKEPQQKPSYRIWEPLVLRHQDILRKCHYVKFPGYGQQVSPVTDLESLPYLFKLLSEYMGKTYKEASAQLTLQYLRGEKVEMKDSLSAATTIPTTIPTTIHSTENLSSSSPSSSPIQQGREFAKYVLELLDGITLGQTPEQDKNLKVGLAISATQAQIPELSKGLEPVKLALVSVTTSSDDENKETEVYLTPTALGKQLGISPRTMNNRLKRHGLQKRNRDFSKGQSAWLPTEKGKEYSILTVEEHRGDDPTRYEHLKWSERVLELFDSSLAA